MCGLYGWMQHPESTVSASTLYHLTCGLATAMETRGHDSTGLVAMPHAGGEPQVLKALTPASVLLRTKEREVMALCTPKTRWLMGHTRASTVGAVTAENTHPFHFGNTIGAHNGHITNYERLAVDPAKYTLPGCDSAAFIAYADQVGIKKALKQTYGSLALTMSQAPYTSIVLYRDMSSDLALAYLKRERLVVWASEEDTLEVVCASLGLLLDAADDGKCGYTVLLSAEELEEIQSHEIGGEKLMWHTHRAPKGYGYERSAETWQTGYKPIAGGHESTFSAGYYHAGLLADCTACNRVWPGVQRRCRTAGRGRCHNTYCEACFPVVIDPDVVIPATEPKGKQLLVILYPKAHGNATGRVRDLTLPITRCPDCRAENRVIYRAEAAAYECTACNLWIEPLPEDVVAPRAGDD